MTDRPDAKVVSEEIVKAINYVAKKESRRGRVVRAVELVLLLAALVLGALANTGCAAYLDGRFPEAEKSLNIAACVITSDLLGKYVLDPKEARVQLERMRDDLAFTWITIESSGKLPTPSQVASLEEAARVIGELSACVD